MGGLCLPTQFIAIPIQMGGFIMAAHDIVANRSSESFWPKHRSVQPFNEKMRWITRLELRRSLQILIATLHNLGNSSNSLEKLKKTRADQVRTLYEWECMLRVGSLRRGYISVKSNPAWYLREELVEDCISRGGCCSRDCGCCERRRLSAKNGKGIGHCTVECMCCIHDQGSEFTAEEKKDFNGRFGKMLRSNNPAFLLRITNAYFSKPLFWKIKTKHK